ncbi:MAG: hypothetical protein ACYTEG_15910 [Planctomycetota bacterium]|jgi:hypothetical protein
MKPITACRWLENKAFMLGPPADGAPEEDLLDQFSTPCWCLKTHDSIGPDGAGVELRACCDGRTCFEPEVQL